MRAVVTRVTSASVEIGGEVRGSIGKGFLVLLGVNVNDTEAEAKKVADKICGLRVFEDEAGKMNVNPKDAGAGLLIISQFTLYADAKSRRPGFTPKLPAKFPSPAQGPVNNMPPFAPPGPDAHHLTPP